MRLHTIASQAKTLSSAIFLAVLASQLGCSASSTSTTSTTPVSKAGSSKLIQFLPPAVAPVVNSALPTSLKSSTTTVASRAIQNREAIHYAKSYLPVNALSKTPLASGFKDQVHMTRAHQGPGHSKVAGDTDLTGGSPTAAASAAATNIQRLFTSHYNDINGGTTKQGYVNLQVIQIDERLNGLINTSSPPYCASLPSTAFNINTTDGANLGSIDPILNFTLGQIQCYGANSGGTTGAGIAFGQSAGCIAAQPSPVPTPTAAVGVATGGCNYSIWVSLGQTAGTVSSVGGFMAAANINNAGSTTASAPESVDGLSISYSPAGGSNQSTINITRFKAVPSTNTFELYWVANNPGMADAADPSVAFAFGYGLRMISDGTHIYSDGYVAPGSSNPFGNFTPYHVCLKASDLSVDTTTGDCTSLYNSFSIATPTASANFNMCEVTLGTSTGSAYNTCIASSSSGGLLSSPPSVSQLNPVAASVASIFEAVYPVTNVSSIALPTTAASPSPTP